MAKPFMPVTYPAQHMAQPQYTHPCCPASTSSFVVSKPNSAMIFFNSRWAMTDTR